MKQRYFKNIGAITEEDQRLLLTKKVLIVGLGGLGGYTAEYLARLGVGELRLCDCDSFVASNLNRQINSSESNLGRRKAEVAAERIRDINGEVKVVVYDEKFSKSTAARMLDGVDAAVDALDNIKTRFVLEAESSMAGVPMIFGGISGWDGQVSTIMPNRPLLGKIYKNIDYTPSPVLPFTPAAVAACQVAETVKLLLGRPELCGKLLMLDLDSYEMNTITVW